MADDAFKQIEQLNKRWGLLKTERSSWDEHWRDISRFLLPRAGRFFTTDRNKGYKRNQDILDNTGTKALRVLASGMMSGMTSPSRPWFMLTTPDKDLIKYQPVKVWLSQVTAIGQMVLARSNTYQVLHGMYEELGAFGTASAFIADDYTNIIHLHPFTIGEYAIATNWKGQVCSLYREFDKTIGEVVKEFGLENCSANVQRLFKLGNLDQWVTVRHAIEPRADRDPSLLNNKNMAFKSVYWECGKSDGHILRESGFKSYPCVSPRWMTQGGDIYGNSPAMDALGDIKQLQAQQFRKSQAIDFQVNPPLQVPTNMNSREMEIFPGGLNYYDPATTPQGMKTAFEVNLDLRNLLLDNQDIRQRIDSAFYKDVFMMISNTDHRMTATEVAERHEEKMVMLGPVVERLNTELLTPLVETVFERLLTSGILPPPPQELQGNNLDIEYISILAQAQKAISVNNIDRFISNIGNVAAIMPSVMDRIDPDNYVDVYADTLGVNPELIISGDKLALIRNQKAQVNQQAQAMQSAEVMSKLGNVSTQNTAAGEMLNMMKGKQNDNG